MDELALNVLIEDLYALYDASKSIEVAAGSQLPQSLLTAGTRVYGVTDGPCKS